jgi:hypothetical protein
MTLSTWDRADDFGGKKRVPCRLRNDGAVVGIMCNVAIDLGTEGGDHGGGGARRKTCQVEDREGASLTQNEQSSSGQLTVPGCPPRSVTS